MNPTTTFFVLAVAMLMLPAVVADDGDDCATFDCLNDSACAESAADFSDHPAGLDFHKEMQRDGQHCACLPGFTGLRCGTPFENCNDGTHKCYNGGNCIPGLEDIYGNDQMYCDCSAATDLEGTRYAGKYCEHPAIDVCDDANDVFCVNGGTCKEKFEDSPQRPCRCHDPTRDGPHCEFTVGQVPECDLDCKNGGHCVLGIETVEDAREMYKDMWRSAGVNAMYCECPDPFIGPNCQASYKDSADESCGDIVCLNGSKCISGEDGQGYCDCTAADGLYAGRFCEFEATQTCRTEDHVDGIHFCVNDGTCVAFNGEEDGVQPPLCECPLGYFGPMCEYIVPFNEDENDDVFLDDDEHPDMSSVWYSECDQSKCKNGGTCRKGAKDTSFIDKFTQDHGGNSSIYNTMAFQKYDSNFEHCVCPDGYMGLDCSQEVDHCGKADGKDILCFFGSTCIHDTDGKPVKCSCDAAQTKSLNFAGKFCQHGHTSVCTRSQEPNGVSFCVNNGACKKFVDDDDEHPGCDCDPGYAGPHCELARVSSGANNKGGVITVTGFVVAVLVLGIAFVMRQKRESAAKETDSATDIDVTFDRNLAPKGDPIHHSFTEDGPVILGDDEPMSNVEII